MIGIMNIAARDFSPAIHSGSSVVVPALPFLEFLAKEFNLPRATRKSLDPFPSSIELHER